jgi:hypothetical protein
VAVAAILHRILSCPLYSVGIGPRIASIFRNFFFDNSRLKQMQNFPSIILCIFYANWVTLKAK